LGDPLCRQSVRQQLTREFMEFSASQGATPGFFPVSGEFGAELAEFGFGRVDAAVEPVVFLEGFSLAERSSRKLRAGLKRARHARVCCSMKFGVQLDEQGREELESIRRAWFERKGKQGAQLLLAPSPFVAYECKRYAVASVDGIPCAFASLVPVAGRNGWLVEGLYRLSDSPSGTSELLLVRLMEEFRDEGFGFLSLGHSMLAVPAFEHRDRASSGEPGAVASAVFRWLYGHASALLNYRSAHRFKLKFLPDSLEKAGFYFYPDEMSPQLLLRFLSAVFQQFDFKGLVHELWDRLSSESTASTLLSENEEV